MASIKYKNVFIKDYYTLATKKEGTCFNELINDFYYGANNFMDAEIKMQRTVIDSLLLKNKMLEKDIDYLIGADLSNQIAITTYSAANYNIPFIGIYSACASFGEELILSSNYIEKKLAKNILTIVSSHNLNSEKQFRYPVEYGALKKESQTITATGSIAFLISNEGNIKIESSTTGKIIDMNIKDVNNMGAVMASSAIDTILNHLKDLKRDINYYDLILTGDLGIYGSKILKDYLKIHNNINLKNHIDAGELLYKNSDETYAGASGPAVLPLTLCSKILKIKKYKKILIVATGSLHSKDMVNLKKSIPSIAHAVSLEVLN